MGPIETYKDRVSGKTLYVQRLKYHQNTDNNSIRYFKDKEMKIIHREDGPAIEYDNGTKVYYQNNKYHRLDGPAITGVRFEAWYVDGIHMNNDTLSMMALYS